ncbi:MAG: glycosyltransferase family 4 protein [Proteobacteria bacterium]|nr:glycosyltransferase family 4 protein [Pseudomonadota bacterium]
MARCRLPPKIGKKEIYQFCYEGQHATTGAVGVRRANMGSRVAFLHSSNCYDGSSLRAKAIGGAASSTIELAEALAARGHRVFGLTGIAAPSEINGVSWRPIHSGDPIEVDLAVANHNASDLLHVRARKRVIWSRFKFNLDKFLRRGGALAAFRFSPAVVLQGTYHAASVSRFIPYSRRIIIPHGIAMVFQTTPPADNPPPPKAVFASQAYRGLDRLVRLWVNTIRPRLPNAELHVFSSDWNPCSDIDVDNLESEGVILRGLVSRQQLAEEYRSARVMLYHGHRDEAFCNAAAEAVAMGVPIVTECIACMGERVAHDKTGLIAPTDQEFADAAVGLLSDDVLWRRLHQGALATRGDYTWDKAAAQWEAAFL